MKTQWRASQTCQTNVVSIRKFMKHFLYYALRRAIGRAQKFSKKVQRDLNKAIMDSKQINWSWGTKGFLTELCATSDTRVWGYILYIYKDDNDY